MDLLSLLSSFIVGLIILFSFYMLTYRLLGRNVELLGTGRSYFINWMALGFLVGGGPALVIIVVLWQIGVF